MSKDLPLRGERNWLAAKYLPMARRMSSQKARLRWLVENFGARPNQKRLPGKAEFVAFILLQSGASFSAARMPRLRTSDLNDLAQMVGAGLAQIVSGEQWKVEVKEPLDRVLIRRSGLRGVDAEEPYGARSTWVPRVGRAFPTSFLLSVGDLIERQQHWLSRCQREDCHRIFVRNDKRQNYCSPRCSQTRRTRRFRRSKSRA